MIRVLLFPLIMFADVSAATVSEVATGVTASVFEDGTYLVSIQDPAWTFDGNVGLPLEHVSRGGGTDSIGAYDEIGFLYQEGGRNQ